jgi:riboflavin kinase/FMN adenylyltransferase
VYGVPAVKDEPTGRVISSTWVRETVRAGDLATAERLLGRRFGYCGTVETGRRLGRELGFPTANLRLESEVHPPAGVYACRIRLGNEWHAAVCNLGQRPTVEAAGRVKLEAHVLDWTGDLYDREVEVVLERFVRAERRFAGLDELKAQIALDTVAARNLLKVGSIV